MRASEKRKNNIIIGVLLGVVVLMGIAYAAFASNLNITGTSSMSENWCIGFDSTRTSDYEATAGISGGTTPTGSMSFSGDSCGGNLKTTASLNASFKQPGDKVEYTLTIGNKGTLAAAIESINVDGDSVTSDTTITKGNIKYIIEMPLSTSLAVNATTTMKITAMFQNDTDIEKFTGTETQTLSVQINAQQDDGNNGMVVTNPFTGSIYIYNYTRKQTRQIYINPINTRPLMAYMYLDDDGNGPLDLFDNIDDCIAQYSDQGKYYCQLVNTIGEYTTDASTLNKTYYFKHDVVDDIITASYVCFVTDTEHCMKGADGGASFETNTEMIRAFQTFYNLSDVEIPSPSNPGCTYSSTQSVCSTDYWDVGAFSTGQVQVQLRGGNYLHGIVGAGGANSTQGDW